MLTHSLLVLHIAVLGYWLGSEFVINSTFRYVCYQTQIPFTERARLMEHVMDVDQHVRYALALQASLGTALAALYGYIPGGMHTAIFAALFGIAWLVFIEAVHRWRHRSGGKTLALIDRGSRYVLLAALLAFGVGVLGTEWAIPGWLRWKLSLFAGVIACGVGIRLAMVKFFHAWSQMSQSGATPQNNSLVLSSYRKATAILLALWCFIAAIVFVSIRKFA
jgi:hypothetical protein